MEEINKEDYLFVACFLSKYTSIHTEVNGRDRGMPPDFLGVSKWSEAYDIFYHIFSSPGRTVQSFRNSLKNERDTFDRFYPGTPRVGWQKTRLGSRHEAVKKNMDSMAYDDVIDVIDNIIKRSDVIKIESDESIKDTEKETLIMARVGQGKFKLGCLSIYQRCVITGTELPFLLIASHIKPWAVSTNQERISKYNGLILSPLYDKLFDRGFISFNKEGGMFISSEITPKEVNILGLDPNFSFVPHEKTKPYLQWHLENIFRG